MRIFIIFIFITITLFADSDDGYKKMHIPKDLSFLKLKKEQKQSIKKLLKEYRKKLIKLHKLEEEWEDEVKVDFSRDKFNKDEFIKKSIKLKKDVVNIEANFFEKIHSILNKRQREKFIKYIEEWEVD